MAELQVQRDDAQADRDAAIGNGYCAVCCALAQQAERMRRDVLTKESSWQENLAEKEAENDRLRARIERMEQDCLLCL